MRKQAGNAQRTVVRAQVPLPASDWSRLVALAAVRGRGRGELAAELLGRALRGVRVIDGAEAEPAPPEVGSAG